MIYQFRIDQSQKDLISTRLDEGYLSMGWSGHPQDLDISSGSFVHDCKKRYGMKTTRVATNLTHMRHFEDGDILVVPHFPHYGTVSLHIVAGNFPDCYSLLPADKTHLGHRIKIKKSYGLDGNISIHNVKLVKWKAKLPWLRLPILSLKKYQELFEGVIYELDNMTTPSFIPSSLDDYLQEELKSELLQVVKKRLQDVSPSGGGISFETICRRILESYGYQVERTNKYDKKGGDVDIICVRERSDDPPFESGEIRLFVQIKKHVGTTDQHAVEQVVQMLEEDKVAEGCVITLADDFSKAAKELAKNHGIVLLNGDDISALLIQNLMNF